jgi:hypothetical protein
MTSLSQRRVTVVLHDRPQSQRLLDLGTSIASLLKAELEGVYVEDAALFRLAGLPFLRELRRDSQSEERLDSNRLLQEWRAMAKLTRQAVEASASRAGLSWRFRVWRGDIDDELMSLVPESELLLLGRLGRLSTGRLYRRSSSGKKARETLRLGVVLEAEASSERLLEIVRDLLGVPQLELIFLLLPGTSPTAQASLRASLQHLDADRHSRILLLTGATPTDLTAQLKATDCDLLMIGEPSGLLRGASMKQCLRQLPYPVIVVR